MYNEENIKAKLDNIKAVKKENIASKKFKSFYKENKPYIDECYAYYLEYKLKKENYLKPVQYDMNKFMRGLGMEKTILVLTANSIEEGILLHGLVDVGKEKLDYYLLNDSVYHVCRLNGHNIVHMHASKTGEELTRKTINAASSIFTPDAIILLGICYGVDLDNYELGNVLISSGLKNYRLNFRDSDENDETIFEAEEEEFKCPNNHLISIVSHIFSYRQIYSSIQEKNRSKVTVQWKMGTILSSNSLMSSKKVKQAVINAFGTVRPRPIGGEMEGGGLLKTKIVEEQSLDRWLVVKGICDWGEKKNSLDKDPKVSEHMKDAIQAMAMVHTWSVFYEMLKQECFMR